MSDAEGTMREPAKRPVLVLVALLAAVSIWNIAYDVIASGSNRSFRMHASDSLFDLVQVEQRSLREGFDIYLLLAEIGGDRTIVAPGGFLYSDRLDGLSDMTLEVDRSADAVLSEDQEARLLAMPGLEGSFALGDEEIDRRLHVVIPEPAEQTLRLIVTDDAAIVVGESTLASVLADG